MDVESIRSEIAFRFSRSSGPGGQHAQKTSTRAEGLFDVAESAGLTEPERRRVLAKLGPVVRAAAQDERSQLRNRELATDRIVEQLREALVVRRKRRPPRRRKPPANAAWTRNAAAAARSACAARWTIRDARASGGSPDVSLPRRRAGRHESCSSSLRTRLRLLSPNAGSRPADDVDRHQLVDALLAARSHAVADVVRDEEHRDALEGRGRGGDLREDVDAVPLLLDHPLQAAHLPFDPAEPASAAPPCRRSARSRGVMSSASGFAS